MPVRTWPVELREGPILLRPLRRQDEAVWMQLRAQNAVWLARWDATSPVPVKGRRPTFGQFVRTLDRQARLGNSLPLAVEFDGELVGQLTVSGITYGSLHSASIGYWVSEHVAGRGIIPTCVAMATDYSFGSLGLHRVEINIRPENAPSLRVVHKLGFRDEGVRERYLHIQGQWCDHRTFALTTEDVPAGLMARWRRSQATQG